MTRRGPFRAASSALLVAALLVACAADPTPTPVPPCPSGAPTPAEATEILADATFAAVATNKGSFTIELYGTAAPIATANFVALARCDFYVGITFHRVIADFVIQAGDPQTKFNRDDFAGLGTGGPGYAFTIETPPPSLSYDPYVVAMANAGGTGTNGSQFFIDLAALDERLPRSYTIFGLVVEGTETVDAIAALPTTRSDVPLDPAVILTITVSSSRSVGPSPSV